MQKLPLITFVVFLSCTVAHTQQKLSVHWEELTAEDFTKGIQKSGGTCMLPFGILEKHGPQLPLGTDLIGRSLCKLCTPRSRNTSSVFPEYYFGQIFEARISRGQLLTA